MTRRRISGGSPIEGRAGFSRAVVEDGWIFVSGCLGVEPSRGTISERVEEQAHQCFRNIEAALAEAGASLADVTRVVYILTDREDAERLYPVFRQYFGEIRPAATAIIAGLLDPRARLEIEVVAKQPAAGKDRVT